MRLRLQILPALVLATLVTACGGDKGTPTSPSPSPSTATRIVALSGNLAFGDVLMGSSREATLTVTNSGNGTYSFSGLTVTGGLASHLTVSQSSGTVPAGGSLPIQVRFTPQSPGALSGTITLTGDHTGGNNTILVSGNGVTPTAPTATVAGILRDAATNTPIGGGTVRVQAGTGVGQSATTDGNGYYSLSGVTGAIVLAFSAPGYDSLSRTVTVNGDTRFDFSLTRTAGPFRMSGVGNTVFDMPRTVSRVRITGTYRASGSNFIVHIGGRLVVNEIIGTSRPGGPTYTGIHLTSGGIVEITNSRDVEWTFEQVQ